LSPVNYSSIFKLLANAANGFDDLDEATAHALYAALFDGGLPEMEMGAFVAYSRSRSISLAEMFGLQRALSERVIRLHAPQRELRPILIPTYCGTMQHLNLTALIALLLQRYEIPVLLHGTLEGRGGVGTAYVLREFNILPSGSAQLAQTNLDRDLLAFLPTAALSPGLAQLLALRARLGLSIQNYIAPLLLDPFDGHCVRLANVADVAQADLLDELYRSTGQSALMFCGTEGEPFVDPVRRPAIKLTADGTSTLLFDHENSNGHAAPRTPHKIDLASTVTWIKQALAGEVAIPHPILNQLACCLFASGYTKDMHQAKAIAAMSAGGLVAA
jgi:anthranilate phosphoribosyltransferase